MTRRKENCEGLFIKYGSTGASTADNEPGKSSETPDENENEEELIPLKSEVALAVKQLKNGKSTVCDDISA